MSKQAFRLFLPALIIFILLFTVITVLKNRLESRGFDTAVLLWGNALVFLVTLASFAMESRGLASPSNPAFLRMFYGSFVLKFIVLIAAAFIYFVSAKKELNKPALFTCMAFYIVYTVIEVRALMKIGKQKKHV